MTFWLALFLAVNSCLVLGYASSRQKRPRELQPVVVLKRQSALREHGTRSDSELRSLREQVKLHASRIKGRRPTKQ